MEFFKKAFKLIHLIINDVIKLFSVSLLVICNLIIFLKSKQIMIKLFLISFLFGKLVQCSLNDSKYTWLLTPKMVFKLFGPQHCIKPELGPHFRRKYPEDVTSDKLMRCLVLVIFVQKEFVTSFDDVININTCFCSILVRLHLNHNVSKSDVVFLEEVERLVDAGRDV